MSDPSPHDSDAASLAADTPIGQLVSMTARAYHRGIADGGARGIVLGATSGAGVTLAAHGHSPWWWAGLLVLGALAFCALHRSDSGQRAGKAAVNDALDYLWRQR